jgi:hypothetical protein
MTNQPNILNPQADLLPEVHPGMPGAYRTSIDCLMIVAASARSIKVQLPGSSRYAFLPKSQIGVTGATGESILEPVPDSGRHRRHSKRTISMPVWLYRQMRCELLGLPMEPAVSLPNGGDAGAK